jgi:hypothetical protein
MLFALYTVAATVAGFKAQATAPTHGAADNQLTQTQQQGGFQSSGLGVTQNVLLVLILQFSLGVLLFGTCLSLGAVGDPAQPVRGFAVHRQWPPWVHCHLRIYKIRRGNSPTIRIKICYGSLHIRTRIP